MPTENSDSREVEAAAEANEVEPASGEMSEDDLDEAVGGAGSSDEQGSPSSSEEPSSGWWNDPNR